MLEPVAGMDPARLAAVADLERRVVAADGGRLKLAWGTLRARTGEHVEDLLWWDGDRLVGFLGLYVFGPPEVELAGMVDPLRRRSGIATALVDAAQALCGERGLAPVLLVTPRAGAGGREFALGRGATLHHTEFALELTAAPPSPPRGGGSGTTIRQAGGPADVRAVDDLLLAAFGHVRPDAGSPLPSGTLVVERAGEIVATLFLSRDRPDDVGVYGFVVRADLRGRGIGREVLRRVCGQALGEGAARVHLEVAVDNDRALGLYTSLGFRPVATEDYFALPGA